LALQSDGKPVGNPARETWVTATALGTALNASYMAESLPLFGIVVDVALLLARFGFAILAMGGTLSGVEPALRLFGKPAKCSRAPRRRGRAAGASVRPRRRRGYGFRRHSRTLAQSRVMLPEAA